MFLQSSSLTIAKWSTIFRLLFRFFPKATAWWQPLLLDLQIEINANYLLTIGFHLSSSKIMPHIKTEYWTCYSMLHNHGEHTSTGFSLPFAESCQISWPPTWIDLPYYRVMSNITNIQEPQLIKLFTNNSEPASAPTNEGTTPRWNHRIWFQVVTMEYGGI